MSLITPFTAYRPARDAVYRIACPPYDVVSDEQARNLALDDSASYVRVIRAEVDFPPETDPHSEAVYDQARKNLHDLIARGFISKTAGPCLYIYRLRRRDRCQTGLVAAVSLKEYEQDLIKKHEVTRPDKENDRLRHLETVAANTGMIFLTYRARAGIDGLIEKHCAAKPELEFVAVDGVSHELWIIDDPRDIALLREAFAAVPALYVADGHHRIAAAHKLWQKRRESDASDYALAMAAAFPHNQLLILPYHRYVRDLGGLSRDEFLKKVTNNFHVRDLAGPPELKSGAFGMCMGGVWRELKLKNPAGVDAPLEERLDVAQLQKNLLGPILKIENPRMDPRIEFVGGVYGTEELEKRCGRKADSAAFACPGLKMDELLAVADAGAIMPPKSTWFEPKLMSGILTRLL